jgi:peptidyl-prolyl cis-trans isomerase NIMA-interacting 1
MIQIVGLMVFTGSEQPRRRIGLCRGRLGRLFGLTVLAVPACGSSTPAADAPDGGKAEWQPIEGSAEHECLDAANREREPIAGAPDRVGLRHILVRHSESRRADASITRSRGLACLRALDAIKALEDGGDWDKVVAEYSDEKGAATRRGSLGTVTREDLDPAFANAAFTLEVNELSYVVETPAGFHVILRVE